MTALEEPREVRGSRPSLLLLAVLFALGCAGMHSANPPLERFDPGVGDRPATMEKSSAGEVALLASFSGGENRAAALAHGVMRELR